MLFLLKKQKKKFAIATLEMRIRVFVIGNVKRCIQSSIQHRL